MKEVADMLAVTAFVLFQIVAFVYIYAVNPFSAICFVLVWLNVIYRSKKDKEAKQ